MDLRIRIKRCGGNKNFPFMCNLCGSDIKQDELTVHIFESGRLCAICVKQIVSYFDNARTELLTL